MKHHSNVSREVSNLKGVNNLNGVSLNGLANFYYMDRFKLVNCLNDCVPGQRLFFQEVVKEFFKEDKKVFEKLFLVAIATAILKNNCEGKPLGLFAKEGASYLPFYGFLKNRIFERHSFGFNMLYVEEQDTRNYFLNFLKNKFGLYMAMSKNFGMFLFSKEKEVSKVIMDYLALADNFSNIKPIGANMEIIKKSVNMTNIEISHVRQLLVAAERFNFKLKNSQVAVVTSKPYIDHQKFYKLRDYKKSVEAEMAQNSCTICKEKVFCNGFELQVDSCSYTHFKCLEDDLKEIGFQSSNMSAYHPANKEKTMLNPVSLKDILINNLAFNISRGNDDLFKKFSTILDICNKTGIDPSEISNRVYSLFLNETISDGEKKLKSLYAVCNAANVKIDVALAVKM